MSYVRQITQKGRKKLNLGERKTMWSGEKGLQKKKMEVSMDRADWDPTLDPCMVAKRVKR